MMKNPNLELAAFRRKQFGGKKSTVFTEIEEVDDGTIVNKATIRDHGGASMDSLDNLLLGNQNFTNASSSAKKYDALPARPPKLHYAQSTATLNANKGLGSTSRYSHMQSVKDRSLSTAKNNERGALQH